MSTFENYANIFQPGEISVQMLEDLPYNLPMLYYVCVCVCAYNVSCLCCVCISVSLILALLFSLCCLFFSFIQLTFIKMVPPCKLGPAQGFFLFNGSFFFSILVCLPGGSGSGFLPL